MAAAVATKLFSKNKWNHLTPIKFTRTHITSGGNNKPVWLFNCDCGASCEIVAYSVLSGATKSCGCLRNNPKIRKHGAARFGKLTPEYRVWRNILTRSKNPNIYGAAHYSKKGIGVCPEWDSGGDGKGFERFLNHIGPRPTLKHSIDRIDNSLGYQPGNVRWADSATQQNNTSRNRHVNFKGEKMTISQAAKKSGISSAVLRDRMFKLNWPEHRWFEGRARAEIGMGLCSRKGVKPRT